MSVILILSQKNVVLLFIIILTLYNLFIQDTQSIASLYIKEILQLSMRRTFVYFISPLLFLLFGLSKVNAQDTVLIPLKIRVGLEVSGPAIYISQKGNLSAEVNLSVDLNEKTSAFFGVGYLNYNLSEYNSSNTLIYKYLTKGSFLRAGLDFNLIKPEKSLGRYWAGIGLHYGISVFNSEFASLQKDNYWGNKVSSTPIRTNMAHFVEATPGVRAELFRNLSIGWTISLRLLLYSGAGKNLPAVEFPGFGNGTKSFSSGIGYFIVWDIPYKKINVITKKEEPEETDDNTAPPPGDGHKTDTGTPGSRP